MSDKIPQQNKGAKTDISSEVELASELLAKEHYQTVKKRFLAINSWKLYAGEEKAEFTLRDTDGNILLEEPKIGDFICIKIPVLHNQIGDGYDWVQIEEYVEENTDRSASVYIRVRPSSSPTKPDEKIAHFFDPEATSNFLIKWEGTKVAAEVHGRNEAPNTENLSVLEKVRNTLVALGGMAVASEIQWKSLTDAIIKYEE